MDMGVQYLPQSQSHQYFDPGFFQEASENLHDLRESESMEDQIFFDDESCEKSIESTPKLRPRS
jgi:hypothetical protein